MQLYVSFEITDNPSPQIHRMEACIKDIMMWMAVNHLKLNENNNYYCNFRLYGIPENAIKKLQRVQNFTVRFITRTSKFNTLTLILKKLHWLPVKYRIIFKVVGLLLTFKVLHGVAPNYRKTLLQSYTRSRSMRTDNGNLLTMPKACRKL